MAERDQFAGFWRRFLALIIDWNLVLIALFPFILLGGLLYPEHVLVEVPYGLFTEEETLETEEESIQHKDGSLTIGNEAIVEMRVLNRWHYLYRETEEKIANETESERVLIDPRTREDIDLVDRGDFILLILMIYWTLSETGRHRGSLGKRIMGIEVVDVDGATITWRRALGRNVGKLLSAFTFFIGFMMAGWTNQKQALHDMMATCHVRRRGAPSVKDTQL